MRVKPKNTSESFDSYFNDIKGIEELYTVLVDKGYDNEIKIVSELLQSGNATRILNFFMEGKHRKLSEIRLIVRLVTRILHHTADDLNQRFASVGIELTNEIIMSHLPVVFRCLSLSNNSSTIREGLQLLMTMASQNSITARNLATAVDWKSKTGPLVERRDLRSDPDVRGCLIQFVTSMLITGGNIVLRSLLDNQGFLNSFLSGLFIDKFSILQLFLNRLIWIASNPTISKTQRCRLFDRSGIKALVKVYRWRGPQKSIKEDSQTLLLDKENEDLQNQILEIRDVLHRLLLHLATSSRHGILFSSSLLGVRDKMKNASLFAMLLGVDNFFAEMGDNFLEYQLICATVRKCPEVLHPYFDKMALMLQPRKSSNWTNRMHLMIQIMRDVINVEYDLNASLIAVGFDQFHQAIALWAIPPTAVIDTVAIGLTNDDESVRETVNNFFESLALRIHFALAWLKTAEMDAEIREKITMKFLDLFQQMLKRLHTFEGHGVDQLRECEQKFYLQKLDLSKYEGEQMDTTKESGTKSIEVSEQRDECCHGETARKGLRLDFDDIFKEDHIQSGKWRKLVTRNLKHNFSNPLLFNTLSLGVLHDACSPILDEIFNIVVGHSQFQSVLHSEEFPNDGRDALINLLFIIMQKRPQCYNMKHFVFILATYGASLSVSDQKLLSILRHYEHHGIWPSEFKPFVWGERTFDFYNLSEQISSCSWKTPNISTALSILDEVRMFRSALEFPILRSWLMSGTNVDEGFKDDLSKNYDPCFLLPLLRVIIDECSVTSQVILRSLFVKHCLTYCVAALASHSSHIRKLARYILGQFVILAEENFKERDLLLCILEHLRNSFSHPQIRLSNVHASFYVRAISLLLKPEHRMFTVVWQYFLAKPNANLHVVPEFIRLLYSSHIDHRVDRQWLLTFLRDGLREWSDFALMERCRVFKHVLILTLCPSIDRSTRLLGLRLIWKAVQIPSVSFSLLLHHNLVTWAQSQFNIIKDNADRTILSNILEQLKTNLNQFNDTSTTIVLKTELNCLLTNVTLHGN